MIERGQEPYISEKMKDNMELAGFNVVQVVKKDTFPGKSIPYKSTAKVILNVCIGRPDQLNRDFLWDLQHIFKSGQTFLEKDLQIPTEKYPQFLNDLVANLQMQPESTWSMTATIGQKEL